VEAQQDRAAGVVAIPGTTKEKNLLSNVESLQLTLTKDDIAALEKIVAWDDVEGIRYSDDSNKFEQDRNPQLTPKLAKKWGIPYEPSY
jgi:hypothetical protein